MRFAKDSFPPVSPKFRLRCNGRNYLEGTAPQAQAIKEEPITQPCTVPYPVPQDIRGNPQAPYLFPSPSVRKDGERKTILGSRIHPVCCCWEVSWLLLTHRMERRST